MPPGEDEWKNVAPSPAARVPRPGRSGARTSVVLSAFGFPVRFGFALWLIDAVLLFLGKPTHLQATLTGLLAGLFFMLGVCALVGMLLAGVAWLAATPAAPRRLPSRFARALAFLEEGTPDELLLRSGALLAVPPLLGVYALGSFFLGQRLILGMARPEFAALALLALHLVLSVVVLVLFPAFASLGSWLALGLSRIPVLGPRLFAGPLQHARWLVASGVLIGAGFVALYREPLSFLPWHDLLQLMAAALFALLLGGLRSHAPVVLSNAVRAVGLMLTLVAAVAGFSLTPQQMFARRIAEQGLLSGRIGHAALMSLLDTDHDGYLPILGGGDCAPLDPSRNPGAIDIPNNQIDEDCDGRDLDAKTLPRLGAYDYPVRADVPKRPTIVLLTIDAFAASHMQAFGEKRALTPNLDAFAKRSVLFKHCFSQGPSTRLSFPAIFSSRWDSQIKTKLTGKHPYPIDSSEVMLAKAMRNAGYDTVAVMSDSYFSRSHWVGLTNGFVRTVESPFSDQPTLPHDGPRVTEAAVAELTRERTQPLFMWVHYYDAHSPHTQPEGVPVYGTTHRDLYDAELTFVDREVGKLLAKIDETTHGEALIVITGDHGIAFDAPRHETFNYGYDLSTAVLHVPLIVHAPFLAPHAVEGLASTMDVTPTLVNLLRLKGPFPFEGDSLVPELLDGKRSRPQVLFHEMFLQERLWKLEEPLERCSLRTERFNLIHDRKGGFFELYDWRNDYFEKHDLSLDPAYEDTLRQLRQELLLFTYVTRRDAPKPAAPPTPVARPPVAAAIAAVHAAAPAPAAPVHAPSDEP